MTQATAAALTRVVARDELADLVARVAVIRDELRRFGPDARTDRLLARLATLAGFAVSHLSRPAASTEPACACGHTAGEHIIRTERLTVCGECGCPGWTAQ